MRPTWQEHAPQSQRVQIVAASATRRGKYGYVIATNWGGGMHMTTNHGRGFETSHPGQPAYLVSTSKDGHTGASWYSEDAIRFTARVRRGSARSLRRRG